ncbi:GntR family transcriptional regulator [Fictibacillus enclensis]|uniref:GntR family transcriptional regulator n=1 Tax=Fictibacillus enclensis TaxID=1017270 RepID=UPI0024BFB3AB|nr:GntR family transcriptional regulator [Fictibacillus enclensis]WHY71474.1 GntR family transcriptional regulator [Fictibacillus enclensis]
MNQLSLQKALPYYQQIQQTIKEQIWKGEYKPGERVYEAQIAKQFSISRSPVREAIRTLIHEGLLVMDERSQISVYKPSWEDVKDIYDCRLSLETTAVALAAERITNEQLHLLDQVLRDTEEAIIKGEKSEIVVLNARFHDLIIDYSGNRRLKKLVEELASLTYYYRSLNIVGPKRAEAILVGHRRIFTAIGEKKPEKAALAVREHTEEDLRNLSALFEQ